MVDHAEPANYVPRRGEIVWLTFDPQAGREQAGRRPALVLSDTEYNRKVGLAVVCPVTKQSKGYPFEVPLPDGIGIVGVVLSDHVRSVDWRGRRAASASEPDETLVSTVVNTLVRVISAE